MKSRTSITIPPVLQQKAGEKVKRDGFSSFSALVEFLIRKELEKDQEALKAA